MTQEKPPIDQTKYQELFDNLKKGVYAKSFDYKLIENLQAHLAEITAFQDTPNLPQDIRDNLETFFWELHDITKRILDFQKKLIIIPDDDKPKLVRVK